MTLGASTQSCDDSTPGNELCQWPDFLAQRTGDDFSKLKYNKKCLMKKVQSSIKKKGKKKSEITCDIIGASHAVPWWICMTSRRTVANTGNSPSYFLFPTRSKKSRIVAFVFFLFFGCLAFSSLYKLGPWTVPAVRIASPSLSVSTPEQTGTNEPAVLNNETTTDTTTETPMPPGKYSVG